MKRLHLFSLYAVLDGFAFRIVGVGIVVATNLRGGLGCAAWEEFPLE